MNFPFDTKPIFENQIKDYVAEMEHEVIQVRKSVPQIADEDFSIIHMHWQHLICMVLHPVNFITKILSINHCQFFL